MVVAAAAVAAHVRAEAAGCLGPAAAAGFLEEAVGECRVPAVAAASPAEASILPAFNDLRLLRSADRAVTLAEAAAPSARTSAAAARARNVRISVPAAAVRASCTCPAKAEAACKSAADRRSATAARSRVPILPAAARVQE